MENRFPNMAASDFDWNDLKYFLAVARLGGLSSAAAAMGTSASTVSRHIAALESRMGSKLFLRQQTGYLLTDEGTAAFEYIAGVESAMLAVERNGSISAEGKEAVGLVRLATVESLATNLITPQLSAFWQQYPNVQVEIITGLTQANLSRREADLALRFISSSPQGNEQDYIVQHAGFLHFDAYCARRLVAGRAPAEARDWKKLPYISWDDSWAHLPMARWLASTFGGRKPALKSNSIQTQLAAVRAGLGVAVLPCFICDRDPELLRLASPAPPITRELWLVYHRDLKTSQRVIAMRDFIHELIRKHLATPPSPA